MNRKIDIALAFFVVICVCFAALLVATASLPAALVLTYLIGVAMRVVYLRWKGTVGERRRVKKERVKKARYMVEEWSLHPDENEAFEYVRESVDVNREDFTLLARHFAGEALGMNGLVDAWREHTGREKLVVAVTGSVDERAAALCQTLEKPKITVFDIKALSDLIAKGKRDIKRVDRKRPKRRFGFYINRKHAPKIALSAATSMLLYMVSGKIAYLLAAGTMLFFAGAGLVRRRA